MVGVKKESKVFKTINLKHFVVLFDMWQKDSLDFKIDHMLDIKQELLEENK
jgi:hypothetical protein